MSRWSFDTEEGIVYNETRQVLDLASFYAGMFFMLIVFVLMLFFMGKFEYTSCPAEDSCYADYHNGQWHIIEGERP